MNATIITIDLAKSIFELALANAQYRIVQRHRFDRDTFSTFMQQQSPATVVMEACSTAHHWGRTFQAAGHEVILLPASFITMFMIILRHIDSTRSKYMITSYPAVK